MRVSYTGYAVLAIAPAAAARDGLVGR